MHVGSGPGQGRQQARALCAQSNRAGGSVRTLGPVPGVEPELRLVPAMAAEAGAGEIASLPWERSHSSLGQFSLAFKTAAACQNKYPQCN